MKNLPLSDSWRFAWLGTDPAPFTSPADLPAETAPVSLPHVFSLEGEPCRGAGVYARTLRSDPAWKAAWLSFEAVDQSCRVWIDGVEAGAHAGGYSRFRVPVPASALQKDCFEVVLYVDNRLNEHVSPLTGDFTVFGGIPRPVSLIVCESETRFDRAYFGSEGLILRASLNESGKGCISLEPHVLCGENASLSVAVLDPSGREVLSSVLPAAQPSALSLPSPVRWQGRKNPALYTLRADLLEHGRPVDQVTLPFGFRTVAADANGFYLNGEKLFLRGVAKHQDRAEVRTAVTPSQIAEDFDFIDEVGANAVRLSHYQHPQAAYDECDRRGILAWAEIPMLKMTEDEALMENALRQLSELILQNIHHPSVYCWGIQNEIAMFRDAPFMHENCRRLHGLIRSLDPFRLSACANLYPQKPASKLNEITDMVGYNNYFGWYYGKMPDYTPWFEKFRLARPSVSLGITEYGVDANLALHSENPRVKDYTEEYQALWHETVYPQIAAQSWLWGSFVWNMFDFSSGLRQEGGQVGINAKGLVTHDRKTRKDAFYYYKAIWSQESFLHLCAKRFVRRAQEKVDVKCYTSLSSVSLSVNGAPFGEAETKNGTALFRDVPLRMGSNEVVVTSGSFRDAVVWERVEEPDPSYSLPEEVGGPVRNWFLAEDDFRREGYFSIEDTANDILESPEASAVLKKHLPTLYATMTEKSVIPLGLSIKSILNYFPDPALDIRQLNAALNQVPNQ